MRGALEAGASAVMGLAGAAWVVVAVALVVVMALGKGGAQALLVMEPGLADAMIAASKAEGKFSSAITVTLTDRSGATWKASTAPRIPGRDYCPLRECDPE